MSTDKTLTELYSNVAVSGNNAETQTKRIDLIDSFVGTVKGSWKQGGRALAEALIHFLENDRNGDLIARLIKGIDIDTGNKTMAKVMKLIVKDFFAIKSYKLNEANQQWAATYDKELFPTLSRDKQEKVIKSLMDGDLYKFAPEKKAKGEDKDKTFQFSKEDKQSLDVHRAVQLAHKLAEVRKAKNMDDPVYKELYKAIEEALEKAESYLAQINIADKMADNDSGEDEQPAVVNG